MGLCTSDDKLISSSVRKKTIRGKAESGLRNIQNWKTENLEKDIMIIIKFYKKTIDYINEIDRIISWVINIMKHWYMLKMINWSHNFIPIWMTPTSLVSWYNHHHILHHLFDLILNKQNSKYYGFIYSLNIVKPWKTRYCGYLSYNILI